MVDRRIIQYGLTGGFILAMGFIATFEGYSPKAYQDVVNVYTICHGHTEGVFKGMTATPQQCQEFYESDVGKALLQVDQAAKVPLSDGELAAYTSFVFNLGIGAFQRSTLLKKLNAGDHTGACNELLKWNKAGGVVLRGLTRRREAERVLCLNH